MGWKPSRLPPWVGEAALGGGVPPFKAVFPAFAARSSRVQSNGRTRRSCSPVRCYTISCCDLRHPCSDVTSGSRWEWINARNRPKSNGSARSAILTGGAWLISSEQSWRIVPEWRENGGIGSTRRHARTAVDGRCSATCPSGWSAAALDAHAPPPPVAYAGRPRRSYLLHSWMSHSDLTMLHTVVGGPIP